MTQNKKLCVKASMLPSVFALPLISYPQPLSSDPMCVYCESVSWMSCLCDLSASAVFLPSSAAKSQIKHPSIAGEGGATPRCVPPQHPRFGQHIYSKPICFPGLIFSLFLLRRKIGVAMCCFQSIIYFSIVVWGQPGQKTGQSISWSIVACFISEK